MTNSITRATRGLAEVRAMLAQTEGFLADVRALVQSDDSLDVDVLGWDNCIFVRFTKDGGTTATNVTNAYRFGPDEIDPVVTNGGHVRARRMNLRQACRMVLREQATLHGFLEHQVDEAIRRRDEAVFVARCMTTAPSEVEHLREAVDTMRDALEDLRDWFDERADADCDQDGYVPNAEMREAMGIATLLAQTSRYSRV